MRENPFSGNVRIGLLLDCAGAYGREVISGVMRYAREKPDWQVMRPELFALSQQSDVDLTEAQGVIAMAYDSIQTQRILRLGKPAVNVSTGAGEAYLPSVIPDDEAIGRMAAAHFVDRGFESFAFVGHGHRTLWSEQRKASFARALAELCPRHQFASIDTLHPMDGAWLRTLPMPTGLLACNDEWAWHALEACRSSGIDVPDEIAVMGVDNDQLIADMTSPALSSIDVQARQIGYQAAQALDDLLCGRTPPRTQRVRPGAIECRASSDVLSIADALVVEAMQMIRLHAPDPMFSIDALSEKLGISRRLLEKRFQHKLGRPPLAEVHRIRLERAKRLLRETTWAVPKVAEAAGFGSVVRLNVMFRRNTGDTPTGYRARVREFS